MTRERRRINELKAELLELRAELDAMESDRNVWRNAFMKHYKWFLKLLGENKNPAIPWLIEDMSKTISAAKYFIW